MTPRLTRALRLGLTTLLVVGAAGAILQHMVPAEISGPVRAQGRDAPVTVTVSEVRARAMPVTVSAIGTVQPIASIPIRTRIDSQVQRVAVEEGAKVTQGDLLFTLDDSLLRAQLAQIDGQIARDEAQIIQAGRDLARAEELLARRIDTPVQRDTAETALKALQAQRAADLGQRQNILAQIGFTEIRAPVSGRIGSITAKAGAVVRAADAQALATLNQIDPIYVASALPQSVLPGLKTAMAAGPVDVRASIGSASVQGSVSFVENAIDAATGTIMVRSTFANDAATLWPGAFVRVVITLGVEQNAVTVPLSALQNGQSGPYVFTVDQTGRAALSLVRVARKEGDEAVIASGIAAGDRVVTSGQLRIAAGTPVVIAAPVSRN